MTDLSDESMVIEPFDDVLRSPKRLHAVELTPGGQKLSLWKPVPYDVAKLFVAVLAVLFVMARVPVLDLLHEFVSVMFGGGVAYYVALPAGIVWIAYYAELDGRSPHRWAYSYLLFLLRPKRTIAGRPVKRDGATVRYKGKTKVWWDLHAPRLHHGWVRGGRVTTSVPASFTSSFRHTNPVMRVDGDYAPVVDREVVKLEVRR